mmetsp:Transcript_64614/g.159055  ORF Transcript_64614/g.159055 Transcript_64614/m.159055 type:complete len:317 (-) Transcript_64614:119-1069(-)
MVSLHLDIVFRRYAASFSASILKASSSACTFATFLALSSFILSINCSCCSLFAASSSFSDLMSSSLRLTCTSFIWRSFESSFSFILTRSFSALIFFSESSSLLCLSKISLESLLSSARNSALRAFWPISEVADMIWPKSSLILVICGQRSCRFSKPSSSSDCCFASPPSSTSYCTSLDTSGRGQMFSYSSNQLQKPLSASLRSMQDSLYLKMAPFMYLLLSSSHLFESAGLLFLSFLSSRSRSRSLALLMAFLTRLVTSLSVRICSLAWNAISLASSTLISFIRLPIISSVTLPPGMSCGEGWTMPFLSWRNRACM